MVRLKAKRRAPILCLVLGLAGCATHAPTDLTFFSVRRQYMLHEELNNRYSLHVEFTSSTDLPTFAARRSFTLGGEGYFCDDPTKRVLLDYPSFWGDGRPFKGAPPPHVVPPYRFGVSLTLSRGEPRKESSSLERKELPEPEDLCFFLRGANRFGLGYRSNVVVVPKAAIKEALRPPAS